MTTLAQKAPSPLVSKPLVESRLPRWIALLALLSGFIYLALPTHKLDFGIS
jgi:hypothetical protein